MPLAPESQPPLRRGRVGGRGSPGLIFGEQCCPLVAGPLPPGSLLRSEPPAVDLHLAEQSPRGHVGRIGLDRKLQQAAPLALQSRRSQTRACRRSSAALELGLLPVTDSAAGRDVPVSGRGSGLVVSNPRKTSSEADMAGLLDDEPSEDR